MQVQSRVSIRAGLGLLQEAARVYLLWEGSHRVRIKRVMQNKPSEAAKDCLTKSCPRLL